MSEKLDAAAQSLVAAQDVLRQARKRLAAASCPEDPPILRRHDSPEVAEALDAHGELLQGRRVVGAGISTRRKGGVDTGEPSVTVYVTRKVTPRTLARNGEPLLPGSITVDDRNVVVDVVEFGQLRRLVACGSSVGVARGSRRSWGTLGVVARDNTSQAPVALTAMHVFDRLGFAPGEAVDVFCPRHGEPDARMLGRFDRGTLSGVDAARVSFLDPSAAEFLIMGIGPIRGWRPLVDPADRNLPVQLYGARSGYRRGTIHTVEAHLAQEGLDPCFYAAIECDEGDSGAALVDDDGYVLGTLVGRATSLNVRVFSPIGLVLRKMLCDL